MERFLPVKTAIRDKIIGIGTLPDGQNSWYDPVIITGKMLFKIPKDTQLILPDINNANRASIIFDELATKKIKVNTYEINCYILNGEVQKNLYKKQILIYKNEDKGKLSYYQDKNEVIINLEEYLEIIDNKIKIKKEYNSNNIITFITNTQKVNYKGIKRDVKDFFRFFTNLDGNTVFAPKYDYFEVKRDEGGQTISLKENNGLEFNNDWAGIKVNFFYPHIAENDEIITEKGVLLLVIAKQNENINQYNLDLGSEATQISKSTNAGANNYLNIIKHFKNIYGYDNDDFLQKETGNSVYYLTGKMWVKKTKGEFDDSLINPQQGIAYTDSNDKSILRFLSLKSTDSNLKNWAPTNNRKHISNPKLSYLDSNVFLKDITLNDGNSLNNKLIEFYDYLYRQFINIALSDSNINLNRIVLLTPNVYSTENTVKFIRMIYQKMNKDFIDYYFFEKQEQPAQKKLIELFAVSESDAVIIAANQTTDAGNKAGIKINGNENILVIDSGKGTTDYSIVNFLDNEKFQNLARGGIIGGGNYITNLYILAFLSEFPNEKRKKVIEIISKETELPKFMEKIENAKIENARAKNKDSNCNVIDIDENIVTDNTTISIPEDHDVIKSGIDKLTNKIIKNIFTDKNLEHLKKVTKIYFTGRNFLYNDFKKELEEKIKKEFKKKRKKTNKFLWGFKLNNTFKLNKNNITVYLPNSGFFKQIAVNIKTLTTFSVNQNSLLLNMDNVKNKRWYELNEKKNNKIIYYYYVGEQTTGFPFRKKDTELTEFERNQGGAGMSEFDKLATYTLGLIFNNFNFLEEIEDIKGDICDGKKDGSSQEGKDPSKKKETIPSDQKESGTDSTDIIDV